MSTAGSILCYFCEHNLSKPSQAKCGLSSSGNSGGGEEENRLSFQVHKEQPIITQVPSYTIKFSIIVFQLYTFHS